MITNPELERAIEEDLDDDDRWLVYADWLQQQGDPRGELITLQHGGHDEKAEAHLKKHRDELLGPLGPVIESSAAAYQHRDYKVAGLDPQWRNGYLDSIRITAWSEMDSGLADDDARERWPILEELMPDVDDPFGVSDLLRLVAASPSCRFLRDLRFGQTTDDYGPLYDKSFDGKPSVLDTLAQLELPALRRLEFGALDFAHGEMEYSWVALGDVSKVLRRHRNLHELVLVGAGETFDAHLYKEPLNPMRLHLGEIDLPELWFFAVRSTDLRRTQLASIRHANWPKLEHLEVWFGAIERRGADCTLDDAVGLIESLATTPADLQYLGLMNCEFADDLIEPLANSAVLGRLSELDLSLGCLSDVGADRLFDHADAFAHLDKLILDRSFLTAAGLEQVAGLCKRVSVEDQREADDDEFRYVAVGE
jgi:uncharacterized protein (TIGR02996 family)